MSLEKVKKIVDERIANRRDRESKKILGYDDLICFDWELYEE